MRDNCERLEVMHRRTCELRHRRDGTAMLLRKGGLMTLLTALTVLIAGCGIKQMISKSKNDEKESKDDGL